MVLKDIAFPTLGPAALLKQLALLTPGAPTRGLLDDDDGIPLLEILTLTPSDDTPQVATAEEAGRFWLFRVASSDSKALLFEWAASTTASESSSMNV